jgi:hypothetical protein
MERLARNAPALLLGAALAAATAMTLVLTSGMTFMGDTWDFLIDRRGFTVDALLEPHNEHLVVIPALIEQLLLRLFGMTSATPEYVLLAIFLAVTALLLYVYVRRRVGPWLALFAAVLVLCFGPAWEALLWPFEITFVGPILFGLAMLLALEREDRRGDIAACVFLTLALGFSGLGIPFVAAAVVAVLQGRRETWFRRAYIVAIPVTLYAAWYLGWGHDAETHMSIRNLLASPRFVADAMAVAVGSTFGLGTTPVGGVTDPLWGRAILVALVVVLGYRQLRKPGFFFPDLWPVAAAAAVSWFLMAFNAFPGRDPTSSRYQYAGVIFILMIMANLFKCVRLSRGALIAAGLVTVAAVGPNLVVLKDGRDLLKQQSAFTRADLGAIEIARRTVDPEFQLSSEVAGTPTLVNVFAGEYLTAIDEYGSPAYSPAELVSAPEEDRRQADIVLSKALPISTSTKHGSQKAGTPRLPSCITLRGGGASKFLEVPLTPGLTTIRLAPGPHAEFALRRFAVDEFPAVLEGAYGNTVSMLKIPRDFAPRRWYLHVEAQQRARVCD